MDTVQDVIDYSNTKVQGNGNITPEAGLAFANEAKIDLRLEMIKRGVEAAQIQEAYKTATIPTTAGNGSTFLWPSDMLLLKTISVNTIDTNPANYILANQVDIGNTQKNISFEWLRTNQTIDTPLFDDRGDWFEIFPTFTERMNLDQAIRIFYYLQPSPYTSVSSLLEYPETTNPYMLGDKIVQLYYEAQENFAAALSFEKKVTRKIDRLVDTIGRGEDKPVAPNGLGLTGWEF